MASSSNALNKPHDVHDDDPPPPHLPTPAGGPITQPIEPPVKISQRVFKILSITQIVVGVLFLVLTIFDIIACASSLYPCARLMTFNTFGTLFRFLYLITGVVGYKCSQNPTHRGLVTTYMILSAISAFLIFASFSFVFQDFRGIVIMFIIFSLIQIILLIISFVLCIRAVCHCQPPQRAYIQVYNPSTNQMSFLPVNTTYLPASERSVVGTLQLHPAFPSHQPFSPPNYTSPPAANPVGDASCPPYPHPHPCAEMFNQLDGPPNEPSFPIPDLPPYIETQPSKGGPEPPKYGAAH